MRRSIFVTLALFLGAAPGLGQEIHVSSLDGFDTYVRDAMAVWDVPGLAVAIVRDDSVLFSGGYGVRELGRDEPVDEHTMFANASTTKAFTAAAAGMLQERSALNPLTLNAWKLVGAG